MTTFPPKTAIGSKTFYTIANLQNDSVALSLSLKDALTKTDPNDVRQAWTDTAVNSAKIVSGETIGVRLQLNHFSKDCENAVSGTFTDKIIR